MAKQKTKGAAVSARVIRKAADKLNKEIAIATAAGLTVTVNFAFQTVGSDGNVTTTSLEIPGLQLGEISVTRNETF